jgi:Flp pilus assembly protein TadG
LAGHPALDITLVVLMFFGAIVDFGQKLDARHDANIAAEEAARAAAGQIDPSRAYGHGTFIINRAAAIHAAQQYLRASGYAGSVSLLGTRRIQMRVTTGRPATFLPLIGVSTLHATGSAVADLAAGCGCRKPHPWSVTCRFSRTAEDGSTDASR